MAAEAFGQTYDSPLAFCSAALNVDHPLKDKRYTGPRNDEEVAAILHVDRSGRIAGTNKPLYFAWRCMNGKAWVCSHYTETGCGNARIAETKEHERWLNNPSTINECRQNANLKCVSGTHCLVGCKSGIPVLAKRVPKLASDTRGFDKRLWGPVSR